MKIKLKEQNKEDDYIIYQVEFEKNEFWKITDGMNYLKGFREFLKSKEIYFYIHEESKSIIRNVVSLDISLFDEDKDNFKEIIENFAIDHKEIIKNFIENHNKIMKQIYKGDE